VIPRDYITEWRNVPFRVNLAQKMQDPAFLADLSPLLSADYKWDPEAEALIISSRLIERLPGDPWRGGA
jgi:hypothetical protein